jgi:uncharacterized alkaline shock family protein YloU
VTAAAPPAAEVATAPLGVEQPPAHRDGPGRLRIDTRVVQKLAAEAANEVDGVSRASAAPIARAIHHPVPPSAPPDQLEVDLHLTVSIRYPLSVREVVERMAAHVSRRVEQLTGRPVGKVRVDVRHLGDPEQTARPRVR